MEIAAYYFATRTGGLSIHLQELTLFRTQGTVITAWHLREITRTERPCV